MFNLTRRLCCPSKRYPRYATIDAQFVINIDDNKTVPLAILAKFLTEQNIESVLLEQLVESLDASCVEALCGT